MFVQIHLKYKDRLGVEKSITSPDLSYSDDDLEIKALFTEAPNGEMLKLNLFPRRTIELTEFKVDAWPGVDPESLMMVNGFQSWTESGEMGRDSSIKPVSGLTRFATGPYGDYNFHKHSGRPGRLHSITYTYFRSKVQPFFLLGSVDESWGYTVFDYDYNDGTLIISRDCQGAMVEEEKEYKLLTLYMGKGNEDLLFRDYFDRWKLPAESAPRCTGWTSWYNYYTDISEAVVEDNLEAITAANLPIDVFQIDDGFQRSVGDWREINDKFPSGMKNIADIIKEKNYKPGLWLAPFICEKDSRLFQEKPEWLLRDDKGRPVKAGWNPLWSGFFYALNIYAPGLREYLKAVFHTVVEEWGFEILKLDFLYAAGILPQEGKSRGAVMCEAMDFLREIAGKAQILGCGVPLAPAFGKVDYCRIGADVGPYWDFRLLAVMNVRERISTFNSLKSTIGRRHLDGNVFRNDPDVFIMRDGKPKVNYNKLNKEQRFTLFFINHLFGGLVFFSDDIKEYTHEQLDIIKEAYPVFERSINEVENIESVYKIKFSVNRKDFLALANLTGKPVQVKVTDASYFNPSVFVVEQNSYVELSPYETKVLRKLEINEDKPYLLGASGHIYPGSQVDKMIVRKDNIIIKLSDGVITDTTVYLGLPEEKETMKVNGVEYPVSYGNGYYYLAADPEKIAADPKTKKVKPQKKAVDKKSNKPVSKKTTGNKKQSTGKTEDISEEKD